MRFDNSVDHSKIVKVFLFKALGLVVSDDPSLLFTDQLLPQHLCVGGLWRLQIVLLKVGSEVLFDTVEIVCGRALRILPMQDLVHIIIGAVALDSKDVVRGQILRTHHLV